jgi:hypothetical protein
MPARGARFQTRNRTFTDPCDDFRSEISRSRPDLIRIWRELRAAIRRGRNNAKHLLTAQTERP